MEKYTDEFIKNIAVKEFNLMQCDKNFYYFTQGFKKAIELIDKKGDIDERKYKFMQKVGTYLEKYPKEMLREFYDYWTEHGENDKKFRKEKEKSFDISKRLARWYKNYSPRKNSNTLNRQTEETVRENLKEVGEDFINNLRKK